MSAIQKPTERQIAFARKLLDIPGQFSIETLSSVLATEAAHARHEESLKRQELERKLRDLEADYKSLAAHHNQHCTCMGIY